MPRFLRSVIVASLVIMAGMASAQPQEPEAQKYPDVLNVEVQARGDHRFDFDVTVSSPYDSPQRYADAFHVTGADGSTYGERQLLHDHANEQPFTRDLYGVDIPAGVQSVIVQARDLKNGYGGKSMEVKLPGR